MNTTRQAQRPGRGASSVASGSDNRRVEIARAALELAAEVGPAGVSTGMIAARLGVSQPALYKHFRTKRDIWAGIGEEIAGRIAANLARVRSGARAPVERIRRQVLGHLRLIDEIPALPEIMLLRGGDASLAPLRERILAAMSGFHAQLVEEVARARADGDFAPDADPEDAASLLLGLIQNLVLRRVLSSKSGDLAADGHRMLALLLRAFLRQPDGQEGTR